VLEMNKSKRITAWVCFWSGSRAYAADLGSVEEVVQIDKLISVPFSPPALMGLGVVRRDVLPIIDPVRTVRNRNDRTVGLVLRSKQGRWILRVDPENPVHILDQETYTKESTSASIRSGGVDHSAVDVDALWAEYRAIILNKFGEPCLSTGETSTVELGGVAS
jgi:chemotaxis signal transduction protein